MSEMLSPLMMAVAVISILAGLGGGGWLLLTGKRKAGPVLAIIGIGGFFLFGWLSSFRHIPTGRIGVVEKKMLGSSLKGGDIIAINGEMGYQADILRDGLQSGYWPFVFDVEYFDLLEVEKGKVGVVTVRDGNALPAGETYAPEWDNVHDMLDATTFLSSSNGFSGPQATVLPPQTYAFNPKLYNVELRDATIINPGSVGVIKSNVGTIPDDVGDDGIVPKGSRGIWSTAYGPQTLYINPDAYYVIEVPTTISIVDYTASEENNDEFTQASLENSIDVKTSDGFKFPIDVRIEFRITPDHAPTAVAYFYDDRTKNIHKKLRQKMNSTVRSVFRNNAESAGALEYVNNRSQQEASCFTLIDEEMKQYGVTITKVAIGDIDPRGESEELAALLKTQTDKQIAVQQEQTFAQQQAAAREEQKLNDENQRALEIKRLATADFDDQIAEREAARQLKLANAESEAIRLRTRAEADGILAVQKAEAEGYTAKASAVGGSNLAMIELFERIASGNIDITPDIVIGDSGEGGNGTMNAMLALYVRQMVDSMKNEPVTVTVPSNDE